MEPFMGVELTKNMRGEVKLPGKQQATEYHIENIIMDGDTMTSHIHDNVSKQIGIWSDVGHAKKALYGHLARLSATHKLVTKTVNDYLAKCFGYVLIQNKADAKGIRQGYKVIPKHAFGDHSLYQGS